MLRELWRVRKRQLSFLTLGLALALWGVVLLRQAVSGRAQRHINAGIEFVRIREPQQAEREWLAAAKLAPNNATLWDLLSTLYIDTGQWSKGTGALQHLLRVAPNQPYVYSRLAACALRSGNEFESQRLAQEELKRNPDDQASLTILAFLSGMQNDTDHQISYLQKFLVHSPDDQETLRELAEIYNASGKFKEALPIVDHLISIRPQDGIAYAMRGAARFEIEASPEASALSEADLLKALQLNPLSAYARYILGRIYLRQGKYSKSITELETAQQMSPRKMDVPFELATAYARSGQPGKATDARSRFETLRQEATHMSVLQKRCSLEKNNTAAHLELGRLMLQNGNYRQSLYYLQRARDLEPNNPETKLAYQQLMEQLQSESSP